MSGTAYIIAEIVAGCGIIFSILFPFYLNKKLKDKYGELQSGMETVIININKQENPIEELTLTVVNSDVVGHGHYVITSDEKYVMAKKKIERSFTQFENCEI